MIKNFWNKWKKVAIRIGDFEFSLLFSLLYYLLIVPFGFVANKFGDFLNIRGFPKWEKVEDNFSSIGKLRQQQ